MVCYPKILWKIENLFTVKNGEPTELYLVLMRIGGVFFIICSVGMIIYLIIKWTNEYAIGDTVSLNFNVVKIGEYNNIIFESLDYFEEAFSHEDGGKYPDINNYR